MPFSCTPQTLRSYISTLVLRYSAVDTHTYTHTHIHTHALSFSLFFFIRFLSINHNDGCGYFRQKSIIMRKKRVVKYRINNIIVIVCNMKMPINCSIL